MALYLSIQVRHGLSSAPIQMEGWAEGRSGPVDQPRLVTLWSGAPRHSLLRLSLEPAGGSLNAIASSGSLHYFRWADATLRPLPAEATVSLARGDAYVALTSEAQRVGSPAIARFVHLRDYFNAERLAAGILDFLASESGQTAFKEDVAALVVEAR